MSDPLQDYRDRVHMPQHVRDRHDAYDKEHTMSTDEIGPGHPAYVTPEDVAATAPDEADAAYTITPAADPDEDHDHTHEEEQELSPEANCVTAFIVVVGMDGSAMASAEIEKASTLVPLRAATVVDMRRGCDEVVHDVNAMQISQQTVAIIQQQAQAMAEQSQQQKMAQALLKKGITVPGRGR